MRLFFTILHVWSLHSGVSVLIEVDGVQITTNIAFDLGHLLIPKTEVLRLVDGCHVCGCDHGVVLTIAPNYSVVLEPNAWTLITDHRLVRLLILNRVGLVDNHDLAR